MRNYKVLCSLFIFSFFILGFGFGYEGYGFSKYQELDNETIFSCDNQCYMDLGKKGDIDYISIKGDINGNGIVGYGFIIGDQISLLNQFEIKLTGKVDEYMNFTDYKQYLSSVPEDTDLILLINGSLNGKFNVNADKFSFGEKIGQGWKDFWNMETFTPYSINLRYGVNINGISVVRYGYILFVIITFFILIFKKGKREQKFKSILYVGIGLMLFLGIRNVVTYTYILNQGLQGFKEDKTYFDLGDYIAFTDKIRKELNLDSNKNSKDDCKIYIDSYQDWPFVSHWENFYLKPCERVLTGDMADYKIYYKTKISEDDKNKRVLIDFNNNYLLKNNSK